MDDTVLVSTLGMFIIDTFRFEDEQTGASLGDRGLGEQIGGGGTYFAVGARMCLSPDKVMMTVDRGSDFTSEIQEKLDIYSKPDQPHSLWRFRQRKDGTTKAVNIYRGEERGFAYLSPKIRLDPVDLLDDLHTKLPPFIHCICSPERASEMIKQIKGMPDKWPAGRQPNLIWEPIPDSAIEENLPKALKVSKSVSVLSPNHEEAASLLGVKLSKEVSMSSIEDLATQLYHRIRDDQDSDGSVPIICIRAGALGSLVCLQNADLHWIPAFHTNDQVDKIVDVTGAGNAYLGGFTVGLALTGPEKTDWSTEHIIRAARMGSVSAALTIEQTGLPNITVCNDGKGELWNGDTIANRLRQLEERVDE
ncbi:Ribokinase-like protein [Meira miltonrushii]|uniref:Ribokinase-like protein n=1 Tax=Meira miltonrushii TaxID=1280837 RepID=A0A316VB92_9BASI|nr:Ribokinase-like protein [Meira miltonrushii]PWN34368.1 Ribokinase-like protein [Meira miltonrushii]